MLAYISEGGQNLPSRGKKHYKQTIVSAPIQSIERKPDANPFDCTNSWPHLAAPFDLPYTRAHPHTHTHAWATDVWSIPIKHDQCWGVVVQPSCNGQISRWRGAPSPHTPSPPHAHTHTHYVHHSGRRAHTRAWRKKTKSDWNKQLLPSLLLLVQLTAEVGIKSLLYFPLGSQPGIVLGWNHRSRNSAFH